MMKKLSITTIVLLLIVGNLTAQKRELGNVTIEELSEKRHPVDSTAEAAVLFQKGEARLEYSQNEGFKLVTVVKTKIKIYKKEGYEHANFARRYYMFENVKELLNFSKANTYNLVGGKVEKTKLKGEGEFDERINKFWKQKKISMPNVKEGSIIEFEYTLTSPAINTIDEWEFQKDIPVNYSEYTTYIPEYYIYNPNLKGVISPKITTAKNRKEILITTKERTGGNSGQMTVKTIFTDEKIEYAETRTNYVLENVPGMKDESYVNNIKNYTASISHELAVRNIPNQEYISYATDWETITKKIYDSEDFGTELNKTGYFEDDLKILLAGLTTQEEKILTIFNFVKSKVKWNEYYGYQCDGGVKKAYRDGSGNVAEINLMLTAMLRYAGIEANPVLISTRSNGIAFFPNRSAYNYVIAGVEFENNLVLLDATNKNAFPNVLPTRDLNWVGRMIRKNGTSASVDLMPKVISKDVVSLMATINKDGLIEGKLKEQYTDNLAFAFRTQYADLVNDSQLERIEKRHKGLEIQDYELTNKTELDKPVAESYSFKHNNSVEIIGDKMYFSPLLFLALSENPFKQDTREYPIDFSYPNQERYIMNITIPDGYAVESLPKSVSIPMTDNSASLKYMLANTDNKIQLSMTLDINSAILPAEYYDELKAFYAEVVKKQTEKIVLKKI